VKGSIDMKAFEDWADQLQFPEIDGDSGTAVPILDAFDFVSHRRMPKFVVRLRFRGVR
jgi:hypothetical protein